MFVQVTGPCTSESTSLLVDRVEDVTDTEDTDITGRGGTIPTRRMAATLPQTVRRRSSSHVAQVWKTRVTWRVQLCLFSADTPSQRVQFILGTEDDDEEHIPHDLFTELDELAFKDGDVQEWKEMARSGHTPSLHLYTKKPGDKPVNVYNFRILFVFLWLFFIVEQCPQVAEVWGRCGGWRRALE